MLLCCVKYAFKHNKGPSSDNTQKSSIPSEERQYDAETGFTSSILVVIMKPIFINLVMAIKPLNKV